MNKFLLVASDVHDSEDIFKFLTDRATDSSCLAFLYAGDLNGENYQIQNNLLNRNYVFIPVIGNCDNRYAFIDANLNEVPIYRTCEYCNKKIFITHGHYGTKPSDFGLLNKDFDIVITGHSHINHLYKEENTVYLNAGSMVKPLGNSKPSYAEIEFLDDNSGRFNVRILTNDGIISEISV